MQVPVIGGYCGGEFRVKAANSMSAPSTANQNSARSFHATLFYDDSKILMDPVTYGSRLILVYNLRRRNSIIGVTQIPYEDSNSRVYRIRQLPRPPPTAEDNLSNKQKDLRDLFVAWSKLPHNRIYVIPLQYSYKKKELCFATLKGSDHSTAEFVLKLLGDFVEVHLATVTKYVGYKEEDWNKRDKLATSGSEIVSRKTDGKSLGELLEKDWTEYLAGNWCDTDNHQLILPPLPLVVPDQLLTFDDSPFNSPIRVSGGKFEGLSFDRASIILWPREKTFDTSLLFGLDQALDVAENGFEMDPICNVYEERRKQMEMLLAFCKKEPNRSWFASPLLCNDLRCDRARPVSPQVASKRSLRLMDLCINWNLPEFGRELIRIIFSSFERADYRCYKCFASGQRSLFVGGICSSEVANKLVDLFVFLGVTHQEAKDLISLSFESIKLFDFKQTGHLAYLATCLFHRQWQETATFVCDEAYSLLNLVYLKELADMQTADGVIGSFIEMLHLIDGPPSSEECRLSQLLLLLDVLSLQNCSLVIGWIQKTDPTLLKSLPSYWDFYMKLVDRLESQLVGEVPPADFASPIQLEESSAQLMSTYLKFEDGEKLDSLVNRMAFSTKPKERLLLAATISSQNSWSASSPSAKSTLVTLGAARVQQLIRFTFALFKWEQPDAVFKGHPEVEKFLHSVHESMLYSAFNSEEEAKVFASSFFNRPNIAMGYSALVSEVIPAAAGGRVSVRITKTPEIYQQSLKQLENLQKFLTPATSLVNAEQVEAAPTLQTRETASNGSQSRSKSPLLKRPKKQSTKRKDRVATPAPSEKRSKKVSTKSSKAADSDGASFTALNSPVSHDRPLLNLESDEVLPVPTE